MGEGVDGVRTPLPPTTRALKRNSKVLPELLREVSPSMRHLDRTKLHPTVPAFQNPLMLVE